LAAGGVGLAAGGVGLTSGGPSAVFFAGFACSSFDLASCNCPLSLG